MAIARRPEAGVVHLERLIDFLRHKFLQLDSTGPLRDFAEQEDNIIERIKGTQLYKVDEKAMLNLVRETREAEQIKRAAEDEAFQADARGRIGLEAIVKRGFGKKKKA